MDALAGMVLATLTLHLAGIGLARQIWRTACAARVPPAVASLGIAVLLFRRDDHGSPVLI